MKDSLLEYRNITKIAKEQLFFNCLVNIFKTNQNKFSHSYTLNHKGLVNSKPNSYCGGSRCTVSLCRCAIVTMF